MGGKRLVVIGQWKRVVEKLCVVVLKSVEVGGRVGGIVLL